MSVPLRIEYATDTKRPAPVRRTFRRRSASRARRLARVCIIAAGLSVLGLACVGAATVLNGFASPGDLRLNSSASSAGLSAVMGSARRSNGYVTVTGSVSNTGGHRASSIEAVVELLDSHSRTVQVDSSMVAFNTVPAGDSAPFKVIVPDDSRASSYRLSFKHPDGRSIE